jgi:hypothetical protein
VDWVLERLAGRDNVCPVRCLSPSERPETLPHGLRRLVFEERLRAFHEETLPAAQRAADEARTRCEIRRSDEAHWAQLESLARRRETLEDEDRRLGERTARMVEEVGADVEGTSPFHRDCAAGRAARDEALARIDARLAEMRAETSKVHGELQATADETTRLKPLAEALHRGRWWTSAWWRARREGDLAARIRDLEKRHETLNTWAERLAREAEDHATERRRSETRFEEETAELRRREEQRRQAECEEHRTALRRDMQALDQQARAASNCLSEGVEPPRERSVAAVREGREAWRRLREHDELQAAAAVQWAKALEGTLATLPQRMAACINVVGAVTSALSANPRFGDHASPCVTFDLLVLEESHLVTESEFLAAARRARRWVLIGEPSDDESAQTAPSSPTRGRDGRGGPSRPGRPSTMRPGFFQRLWRLLHADPGRLPYAWFHRDGRLVCRLRSPATEEQRWVTSEFVADRPEIELRIAAPPRTAPRLLEVLFPSATTIHEAKSFIVRELGELPIQARGSAFRWRDDPDQVVLDLSDGAASQAAAVELAVGVRERIGQASPAAEGGAGWQTCSLEFDRAGGWTRELAERWVEEHLQTGNLGRTVLLHTHHRSTPALARFLSGLLFGGACPPRAMEDGPAVEFVAVPPLDDEGSRRRPDSEGRSRRGGAAVLAPRLRPSRGGAGLEIDLADPRRLDPLPAELRAALPRHGLVNLFEAQAVLRKLEALAADSAFRAAAAEWAHREAGGCGGPGTGCTPASCRASAAACAGRRLAVAVMALYPSQAELIRLLAAQSRALAAAPVAVEIGTPDAFRQRECFTALISLTRSHSHRAVAFGGDPSLLPTALTRAAARLVLFGDVGTLARRCQWNGAVDHLDQATGECERGRIARLVAYLHGHGPHPSTFGLEESGRV